MGMPTKMRPSIQKSTISLHFTCDDWGGGGGQAAHKAHCWQKTRKEVDYITMSTGSANSYSPIIHKQALF